MKLSFQFALLASALILPNVGCGTSENAAKPSYADLVVIYNAELATLDRLEAKKAKLIEDFEKQHQPNAEDALQAITGALNSANETEEQQTAANELSPKDDLDRAVENAERMQEATSQLLAAAEQANAANGALGSASVPYSEELTAQLAALDQEIAEQQARVDRAREARDAAETK